MEETELPTGWIRTTLSKACLVERGITFPAEAKSYESSDDNIACLRTTNVQNLVIWDDLIYVPKSYIKNANKLLQQNDILISMANSRELVGKVSFVDYVPAETTFGGFIAAIRSVELVRPKFLFYYLRLSTTIEKLRAKASQTVNIANISLDGIYSSDIPLPPLSEQQRIVAAIEQQFTRLDAGVAALKSAQKRLKRYRAAVLKAAVEGKLTEEWRAEHPSSEPATMLLERILVERRAKWEADLRAKGKDPAKVKYVEPATPDVSDLAELPEGWCWGTVEQVGDIIGGVTKGRDLARRLTSTLPYLRVANVQRHFVDLSVIKTIEVPQDEIDRYLLHMGDVLLTEGGDADKLGRAALWQNQVSPCIHQNHIFRARLIDKNMPPSWLMFYANSEQGRAYFLSCAKQTVNLASINLTQLRHCPIPLPPLEEQQQIVDEVERRLSIVSQLEATLEANLKRAERMRQSILKEAFAGRLVPQDPDDEPASILLERIRQEREAKSERKQGKEQSRQGNGKKAREKGNPKRQYVTDMMEQEPEPIDSSGIKQVALWHGVAD